jgi:phosphatidylglycerol:prolipoprotein diacylglycerol transferase
MIHVTPSATLFTIGPATIAWYGIGYAVALAVGVWLASRQARIRGEIPDHIANAIIPVFALGLIGARLYHVIDQWNNIYAADPLKVILPPYTGLALYGGVIGGIVGTAIYTRRQRLPFQRWADIAVPSLFFGQAIARWGNFFNQELYGPPTNLPWGIEIDCAHRVAAYPCALYPQATTGFHPLFFYESALTLLGGLIALWASRRLATRMRDGDLLSFWLVWYGLVRSYLETFRLTYDWTFFGVPTAVVVGLGATAIGVATFVLRHRGQGRTVAEMDELRRHGPRWNGPAHDSGGAHDASGGPDAPAPVPSPAGGPGHLSAGAAAEPPDEGAVHA